MDIGVLGAFLGGALALLSPCGALLLPAFFASTVGSGPRLALHGAVFYLGLLVVLVPLGVGAGALGSVFVTHRTAIIVAASLIMIVLGVVQILGFGFDLSRALPGSDILQSQAATRAGLAKTVLLGASSGVAGFCAGPVLGAVLTLAAARGDVVTAGLLLAVYGAGMVVPLLLLASVWGRLGARSRAVLRGRTFTVAGRELHTTSVVTGLFLITVGVLFWTTNGLVGMPELLPTSVQSRIQSGLGALSGPVVDIALFGVVVVIGVVVWLRIRKRHPDRCSRPTPRKTVLAVLGPGALVAVLIRGRIRPGVSSEGGSAD